MAREGWGKQQGVGWRGMGRVEEGMEVLSCVCMCVCV